MPATFQPISNVSQSDKNYAYASVGLQAIGSIAGAIANTNAFKAQIEADTKNRLANMNNVMDSFEYESYKLKEAHDALDSQFSDKVSERLLKTMKDAATAKVLAAETGASNQDVSQGLKADEMFDVAVINSQRQKALGNVYSERERARLNAVNQVKSLASGGVNIQTNTFLSGLAGATSTLGSLLSTMPNSVRADFFNFNTNGSDININESRPH